MKQERNNEWIEALRQSLRDAELPPSEDGWERLQRELARQSSTRGSAPEPEAVKRPAWKILWPRVAAAAAVVLIGLVAGNLLLRPDPVLESHGDVIVSAADGETPAVSLPPQADAPSPSERLAETVGLSEERSEVSSSLRSRRLLAAKIPADREQPAEIEPAKNAGTLTDEAAARSAAADRELRAGEPDRTDAATHAAVARSAAAPASPRAATRLREATGETPAARRPARSRASFSVHAGGGLSGGGTTPTSLPKMQMSAVNDLAMTVGTGDNMTYKQRFDAGDNTYRHHQPLSFGLSVSKAFPYGLSLESGLIYTLVRSDVRTRYSSEDVSQKLHFVGIPVRLNWQFLERGALSLYIGAGGMAEKCVSARFGTTSVNEPGLQWSALAAVGVQYRLGDVVGLYFEPEGSYYFTQTRLRTVRTDSPLTLSLRLGVRLTF